jgi:hypothetical protein
MATEFARALASMHALTAIDLIAVAVFAITGALTASRKQLDIVAFIWLGVVTGVGGGTLRDLLLGVPVFWVQQPAFVLSRRPLRRWCSLSRMCRSRAIVYCCGSTPWAWHSSRWLARKKHWLLVLGQP